MTDNFLFKEIKIKNLKDINFQLRFAIDYYRPKNQNYFNHIDKDNFLKECPSINDYFVCNNFEVNKIAIIEIPGRSESALHIDTQNNFLALNFPVINCDQSYTAFYKIVEGSPNIIKMANGLTNLNFDNCGTEELDRFYLKQNAILFNTKIPHKVFNFSDNPRLSISFRFVNDPWLLIQ
jgi:hypothetical protein